MLVQWCGTILVSFRHWIWIPLPNAMLCNGYQVYHSLSTKVHLNIIQGWFQHFRDFKLLWMSVCRQTYCLLGNEASSIGRTNEIISFFNFQIIISGMLYDSWHNLLVTKQPVKSTCLPLSISPWSRYIKPSLLFYTFCKTHVYLFLNNTHTKHTCTYNTQQMHLSSQNWRIVDYETKLLNVVP